MKPSDALKSIVRNFFYFYSTAPSHTWDATLDVIQNQKPEGDEYDQTASRLISKIKTLSCAGYFSNDMLETLFDPACLRGHDKIATGLLDAGLKIDEDILGVTLRHERVTLVDPILRNGGPVIMKKFFNLAWKEENLEFAMAIQTWVENHPPGDKPGLKPA